MASFIVDCKAKVRRSGKSAVGGYGRTLRGGKLIVSAMDMSRIPSVVCIACTTEKVLWCRVRFIVFCSVS